MTGFAMVLLIAFRMIKATQPDEKAVQDANIFCSIGTFGFELGRIQE